MSTPPIRLAVFASGEGTNLENIIRYFSSAPTIEVALVVSNRPEAKALERARCHGIPCKVVNRTVLAEDEATVIALLHDIDYIILAGFLLRIPTYLIAAFPQRIINIHPSLLPAFRGSRAVEQAVEYGVKVYGITIHYVDEELDGGKIIAQRAFEYEGSDPEEVHRLGRKVEHQLYVETIDRLIKWQKEH